MNLFKNTVVLILVSGLFAFAQAQGSFAAKLGINFSGSFELNSDEGGSEDGDVGTGFEVDLEYLYPTSPQLFIGGGAGYLFSRSGEDSPDDFSIIPIYGLIKYQIQTEGSFVPAIEGRIGYNFLNCILNHFSSSIKVSDMRIQPPSASITSPTAGYLGNETDI